MIGRMMSVVMALGAVASGQSGEFPGASGSVSGPGEHVLVEFDSGHAFGSSYAVVGEVRTEGVAGSTGQPAYLETMNYFDGAGYFSKEFDASGGGLRSLEANSEWRRFSLPFYPNSGSTPERVEFRAILPGEGTVEIRGVRLVSPAMVAEAGAGAWWSDSAGGWIGGLAGTSIGLLGGLIGFFAWRQKGRTLVFAIMGATVCLGGIALTTGLIALVSGQPYAVWYPLVLLGTISSGVMAINWYPLKKRFEAAEMQRLSAMDAA